MGKLIPLLLLAASVIPLATATSVLVIDGPALDAQLGKSTVD